MKTFDLLLGNKFNDFATKQEEKANTLQKKSKEKDIKIAQLEQRVKELEEGKK